MTSRRSGYTAPGAPRRRGGSVVTPDRSPRRQLTISADLDLVAMRAQLATHGCLNPVERASELVLTGRTRFYRGGDDPAVVDVTLDGGAS